MQLIYDGKKDSASIQKRIAAESESALPVPIIDDGALFHGDNFQVMARMAPNYREKIDLVYIDPPFNTRSGFYCSQNRAAHVSHSQSDELAYSDTLPFYEYLEYMRERLSLIHILLSPAVTLLLHADIKLDII